jgi:uncharacterized protein YcbK (DUF882 family)
LTSRLKKALASTALVAALSMGIWSSLGSPAMSGSETRTISMKQIHTGEAITITYMVNGKYVPSAMKKLNWFLRDWRRNEVTTIDPRTIDLVWELHADLGSKKPVHIVSGYRSARTNSFLKRSGRNVAKKSQHIQGKALDIFFPDVPTIRMRNSALVRKVGGVGYYRSAGGPTGFLHVDSGKVRHWGPGISSREMAKIFRDYGKTVGARKNKAGMIAVAESSTTGKGKPAPDSGTLYDNEDMAELAETAAEAPVTPKDKPKLEDPAASELLAVAAVIPKPRPKPIEILMAAAMNIKIEPVSAAPEGSISEGDQPASDGLGALVAATALMESPYDNPISAKGKNSITEMLDGEPVLRTLGASAEANLAIWPSLLTPSGERDLRLNGQPQPFAETAVASILPGGNAEAASLPRLNVAPSQQETAEGKTDSLVVNREAKGNLGGPKKLKLGALH